MMKVPKGTSDYQASWIVDEDEEEEDGDLDEESSDDDDDDMLDEAMDGEDEEINSQVHTDSILRLYYRQHAQVHDTIHSH